MREVSVIKDVFRGTPHAIVMRDNGIVKFKALTQYAKRFVEPDKTHISMSDINIPDGFVRSDFRPLTGIFQTAAESVFSEQTSEYANILSSLPRHESERKFSSRVINEISQKSRPLDAPLVSNIDPLDKIKLVSLKARKFKSDVSFGSSHKSLNKIISAYNKTTNTFKVKDSSPLNEHAIETIRGHIGSGKIRRLVGEKSAPSVHGANGRRTERRIKSLLGLDEAPKPTSLSQRLSTTIASLAVRR